MYKTSSRSLKQKYLTRSQQNIYYGIILTAGKHQNIVEVDHNRTEGSKVIDSEHLMTCEETIELSHYIRCLSMTGRNILLLYGVSYSYSLPTLHLPQADDKNQDITKIEVHVRNAGQLRWKTISYVGLRSGSTWQSLPMAELSLTFVSTLGFLNHDCHSSSCYVGPKSVEMDY